MAFNPFIVDDEVDYDYPADQYSFTVDSQGFLLNGFINIASGKGPHPTIMLLHGIPGTEKNTDMSHVFKRAGFNVVLFSYRGNWGSKGSYSFRNNIEDCHNVLNFLRSHHEKYRIDPNNIIVIGNSLGGFNALYTVFKESKITKVASISGFHLQLAKKIFETNTEHKEVIKNIFSSSHNALDGTTSEKLMQEISEIDTWDFNDYYKILASKDVLLISSLKDEDIPPTLYDFPLIKELESFDPKNLSVVTFDDANHSYSSHRIRLTRVLLDWLMKKD